MKSVALMAVGMQQAASALGVSRMTLYNLVARGELRTVKLGKRRLVPFAELERLLGLRPENTEAPAPALRSNTRANCRARKK